MTDWVTEVELSEADEINKINKSGSPLKFAATTAVEVGDTVAGITAIFSRPLTDEERAAIKGQVIALCEQVEAGLLKDFEIAKGMTAYKEFAGRDWKFVLSGHLRTEQKPPEE